MKPLPDHSCRRFPRRAFLADLGMGFTGLAVMRARRLAEREEPKT